MSRHALRRLLWIGPILIAVTLASFALLAYVPDPASDPAVVGSLPRAQALELARVRFLDLPRFFNEHPVDVVRRVEQALDRLEDGEPSAELGRAELGRLGGAALPYVLARLDSRAPATRARVALALQPVARRMGLRSPDTADPERAVAYWNRFWSDRSIDFRPGNAHRVVARLAAHTTSARRADLLELDTYVLDELMSTLAELGAAPREGTATTAEAVRRLVAAAAHVTQRDDVLGEGASPEERAACIRRWREWWLVYRSDFVAYDGPARVLATVADTQYGRWAEKVVLLRFGTGSDGVPIFQKLSARAPMTLGLVGGAIAIAYLAAVVSAVINELVRRRTVDAAISASTSTMLVVPLACVAAWLAAGTGVHAHKELIAVLLLGAGLVVSPFAQVRLLLREVRHRDYVRAAHARGYHPLRVVARHALRNAIVPIAALGSVELPTALGGAFVVEKAFGLAGLGEETARAVQTHDVAWLVGVALLTALVVTLSSILSDLLVAAIDPRLTGGAVHHASATP